jgi:Tfp pilus assembly PilM family ATPase
MSGAAKSSSWLAPSPPNLAIEISSRRVTVAGIAASGRGLGVTAYASEALLPGVVAPALTGQNLRDRQSVVGALRRALDKAGLRSAGRAALVVPDAVARVTLVAFAGLPARAADVDSLLRGRLRKSAPFPIDDARLTHFVAHTEGEGVTLAAVVARNDVLAEYEGVADEVGIHAGIVDLASLNVANAVIAGGASAGDWLLVCLAPEATTLAILRGDRLMFYRQRATLDDEPLSALVHQTAMYHEDRLGGSRFARVWLSGAAGHGPTGEAARRDIEQRLGVGVQAVDVQPAVALGDRGAATPEILDALAAPVGVLVRELKVA